MNPNINSLNEEFQKIKNYKLVTNTPFDNPTKPYLLKYLFGSKTGLMKRILDCHKNRRVEGDFSKLYRNINKERKKLISPQYLDEKYLTYMCEMNMLPEEEAKLYRSMEQRLSNLEKEMTDLGESIAKRLRKIAAASTVVTAAVMTSVGVIVGAPIGALVGGGLMAIAGVGAIIPFIAAAAGFPAFLVGMLTVGTGIGSAVGGFAGGATTGFLGGSCGALEGIKIAKKSILKKSDMKEIKKDLKKYTECSSNNIRGVSPKLVFIKDGDRIGLPITGYIVIFEPQDKIKHFYNEYNKIMKEISDLCKRPSMNLFMPESSNYSELRMLAKYSKNYTDFVEYVKSEAAKYVKSKEKQFKRMKKFHIKSSSYSNLKYEFAQYLTKLKYKEFDPERIRTLIPTIKYYHRKKYKKLSKFLNNSFETREVTIEPKNVKIVGGSTSAEANSSPRSVQLRDNPMYHAPQPPKDKCPFGSKEEISSSSLESFSPESVQNNMA